MSKNVIMVTIDSLRNDYYNPSLKNLKFLNFVSNRSTYFGNCFSLGDDTGTTFPQFLTSTYLNLIPYEKHKKGAETNRMCQIASPRKSIAETLKENGYNTYSFQTSPNLSPFFGYDKGFDFYKYINPLSSSTLPYFIKYLYKSSYANVEEVIEQVNKIKFTEPFFLWIHFNDIHEPYHSYFFPKFLSDFLWSSFFVPRPSYSQLAELNFPKISNNLMKKFKSLYMSHINYLDKFLYELFVSSRIVDLDESLFVLSADHGQSLGERQQWGHGYGVLPTRDSSNIPLFVSTPSQTVGKVDNRFCSTMDIVPTISEIIGLPLLDRYDGHSLKGSVWKGHDYLVWSNSLDFKNNKFSVRILDEPYIFWQDDFNFSTPKIFRIHDDKLSHVNDNELMVKYEAQAKKHINEIWEKQKKYPLGQIKSKVNVKEALDNDVLEALKALGYA